jgi:hypothetical protein
MDQDDAPLNTDESDHGSGNGSESWLAEQARLVLLEDGR